MANNENAAVATPKTNEELLVLAEARVAKLKQRITTAAVLNGIEPGQTVGFRFGRNIPERTNKAGETVPARAARQLTGVVMGVQDITDDAGNLTGKVIKVQAGEGFDADIYKVNARDITSVGDTATEQDDDDDAVAEDDASEVPASDEEFAGEDPLEAAE